MGQILPRESCPNLDGIQKRNEQENSSVICEDDWSVCACVYVRVRVRCVRVVKKIPILKP